MRNLKKVLSLALALVMLIGMMVIGAGAVETDFADNGKIGDDYKEAVAVMDAIGVINGKENNNFDPQGTLTRAEAAAILVRMTMGTDAAKGLANVTKSGVFTDMADHWAAGYVDACYNQGIVLGMAEGIYGPNNTLTGTQFAAMLLRAIGVEGEFTGDAWQAAVIAAANKAGLSEVTIGNISRESAAKMGMDGLTYTDKAEETGNFLVKGKGANQAAVDAAVSGVVFESRLEAISYMNALTGSYNVGTDYDIEAEKDDTGSLLKDVFNVTRNNNDEDAFGNVTRTYTDADGNVLVEIQKGTTLTYTTEVDGKTIWTDLGKVAKITKATVTEDGKSVADLPLSRTASGKIGGNGAVVNVFRSGNDVSITVVNTYLGTIKANSYKAADEDKDVKEQVKITVETGKAPGSTTGDLVFETAKFTKDDEKLQVLYTAAWDASANAYAIVDADFPEEVTGTPSRSASTSFVMDGTTYKYSKKAVVTSATVSGFVTGKTEATFLLDGSGYVLGTKTAATSPDVYAVLYDVANSAGWTTSNVLVRLIEMDGSIVEHTVTKLNGASTNKSALDALKGQFVKVEPDGENIKLTSTSIDTAGTGTTAAGASSAVITRNTATLYTNSEGFNTIANGKTVFLLEKDNKVTAYTGISNVPTTQYRGDTAHAVIKSGVAVAVYVKDGVTVGGTSTVNDITFVTNLGKSTATDADKGSFDTYNAVIDGEIVTLEADTSLNLTENKLYAYVVKNDKDLVTSGTNLTTQVNGVVAISETGIDAVPADGVITLGGNKYVYGEDTVVYFIDEDGTITDGLISDIVEADTNDTVLGYTTDGLLTALFVQKVANPASVDAGDLGTAGHDEIDENTEVTGNVTLDTGKSVTVKDGGTLTITGSLVLNEGSLIFEGDGELHVTGNLTITDGTFTDVGTTEITVDGTTAINGAATIKGTLNTDVLTTGAVATIQGNINATTSVTFATATSVITGTVDTEMLTVNYATTITAPGVVTATGTSANAATLAADVSGTGKLTVASFSDAATSAARAKTTTVEITAAATAATLEAVGNAGTKDNVLIVGAASSDTTTNNSAEDTNTAKFFKTAGTLASGGSGGVAATVSLTTDKIDDGTYKWNTEDINAGVAAANVAANDAPCAAWLLQTD